MAAAEVPGEMTDYPARSTLDAEGARAYLSEATRDMFDVLDDDVEAVASDLFESDERLLALFAGHPTNPRHFLACSERSLILFKRDHDGALSIRILPISRVEAVDVRPLSPARTGAMIVRTAATSAGPMFTFPLETHFAYFRVVALTRMLRRLQAGETVDAAAAHLGLEAYAAEDVFVAEGQPSSRAGAPAASDGEAVVDGFAHDSRPSVVFDTAVLHAPSHAHPHTVPPPDDAPSNGQAAAAGATAIAGFSTAVDGLVNETSDVDVLPGTVVAPSVSAPPVVDADAKREAWFLYREAAQHGPYNFESLRKWYKSGKLSPTEFIRAHSMDRWIRVKAVFTD